MCTACGHLNVQPAWLCFITYCQESGFISMPHFWTHTFNNFVIYLQQHRQFGVIMTWENLRQNDWLRLGKSWPKRWFSLKLQCILGKKFQFLLLLGLIQCIAYVFTPLDLSTNYIIYLTFKGAKYFSITQRLKKRVKKNPCWVTIHIPTLHSPYVNGLWNDLCLQLQLWDFQHM